MEIFGLCSVCGANAFKATDKCWSCGKHTVQLYLTAERRPAPWTLDEAAPPEHVPVPQVLPASTRYSGAGPMWAIILECIALLLYWPGTISDTVTFAVIPRSTNLYTAILLSVVIALGSCAALLAAVQARRHGKPGAAAAWAFVALVGLIFSVVVGWGATDDIYRACYILITDPCPGRDDAVALRESASVFWLLATLTSLGSMIGDIVRFARRHPTVMIVHGKHSQ